MSAGSAFVAIWLPIVGAANRGTDEVDLDTWIYVSPWLVAGFAVVAAVIGVVIHEAVSARRRRRLSDGRASG